MSTAEQEKKEEELRQKLLRERIARAEFAKEREFLRHQSNTSFGKMVLASYPTKPQYSIGLSKRQPLHDLTPTPGPIYSLSKSIDLLFDNNPKWSIGNSLRPPLSQNERYDYYKVPYDESTDISSIPKLWNSIKGGAPTYEKRGEFVFEEEIPGPARYEPKYEKTLKKSPTYTIGLKLNSHSIIIPTGSGKGIGPQSYDTSNENKLSHHKEKPVYSFTQSKRHGLHNKIFTKNESYCVYSSIGNQVMSAKTTLPIESFTKATREKDKKLGFFKSMMEKNPMSVRIPMPKF